MFPPFPKARRPRIRLGRPEKFIVRRTEKVPTHREIQQLSAFFRAGSPVNKVTRFPIPPLSENEITLSDVHTPPVIFCDIVGSGLD
jgi:hypothetical protein